METATQERQQEQEQEQEQGDGRTPTRWVVLEALAEVEEGAYRVAGEVEATGQEQAEKEVASRGEDDGKPRTGLFRAVSARSWRGATRFTKETQTVSNRERVD